MNAVLCRYRTLWFLLILGKTSTDDKIQELKSFLQPASKEACYDILSDRSKPVKDLIPKIKNPQPFIQPKYQTFSIPKAPNPKSYRNPKR